MNLYSHSIITQNFKIQFSPSSTGEAQYQSYTINIQACKNIKGDKTDWDNKINIKLSLSQLIELYSVMSGRTKKCELFRNKLVIRFERQAHLKEPERQPKAVFMYASDQNTNIEITQRIEWQDCLVVSHMLLKQYSLNFPMMSIDGIINSVSEQVKSFSPIKNR